MSSEARHLANAILRILVEDRWARYKKKIRLLYAGFDWLNQRRKITLSLRGAQRRSNLYVEKTGIASLPAVARNDRWC